MTQRLKTYYIETIIPKLQNQFKYLTSLEEVPKIEKIVINRGIGAASQNQKIVDSSLKEIALIAGQKGIITRSKKAIAGFSVLQSWSISQRIILNNNSLT